jgi:hypothetical protein
VQIPEQVIRDTVTAVFSNRAYGQPSLLRRLGRWLLDWLVYFLERLPTGSMPPQVFWTLTIVVAVLLVTLLIRYALPYAPLRIGRGRGAGSSGVSATDYWEVARQCAARGDYTAAAHALYASLLHTIAGGGEIQLDEAKTIGDYSRELAARSSARLPRFREFARGYETVIYGIGFCDRERYERLQQLAQPIVGVHA